MLTISHLTDVEGNLRHFQQWAQRSRYIQFHDGCLSFHNSSSKNRFIYGGDFCDKGPGDLRIGRALVDFKTKNPHEVTLIAGNRDIKCRRFTYELNSNVRERLLRGAPAYWNPHSTPQHYVRQKMRMDGIMSSSQRDMEQFIQDQSDLACKTLYLKWMLYNTMGSASVYNKQDAFEYRRMELAQITGASVADISDNKVTLSFIESVSSHGVVTQFLKAAQLGVVVGDTLFIHGAVTIDNMGVVPGMDPAHRIMQVNEWIQTLNDWYAQQITEWLTFPTENYLHAPGHKPLDHYVILNPQSVVTSNWYNHGKLMPVPDEVITYLNNSGIYRVVSGHQPFSDFPLIIRSPNLEVIVGDTSYSDTTAIDDCRGKAIHNLEILQTPHRSRAMIDAIRAEGFTQQLVLPSPIHYGQNKDSNIGHFTPDGLLIRPINDSTCVGSQLDGFEVIDTRLR